MVNVLTTVKNKPSIIMNSNKEVEIHQEWKELLGMTLDFDLFLFHPFIGVDEEVWDHGMLHKFLF